jgi:Uma2 family endonuclease
MGTTTLLSFEQLPDEPGKVELLDGELIQLPPAKLKHMEVARRIHLLLMRAAEKAGVRPSWVMSTSKPATSSAVEHGSSQT